MASRRNFFVEALSLLEKVIGIFWSVIVLSSMRFHSSPISCTEHKTSTPSDGNLSASNNSTSSNNDEHVSSQADTQEEHKEEEHYQEIDESDKDATQLHNESLADMRRLLKRAVDHWKASNTRSRLQKLMLRRPPQFYASVTRIVCIGLGTISDSEYSDEEADSSMQLACMLDLAEMLKTHPASQTVENQGYKNIEMYAQDPKFTKLDKALLKEQNITVMENPQIWPLVNDSTFVFAPFFPSFALPEAFCRDQFRYGKGAPAILSNSIDETVKPSLTNARLTRRLSRNIIKRYRRTPFPHSADYKGDDLPIIGGHCWDSDANLTPEGEATRAFRGLHVYFRNDFDDVWDDASTEGTI